MTASIDKSSVRLEAIKKLTIILAGASSDPGVLAAAERLAGSQVILDMIKREKIAIVSRCFGTSDPQQVAERAVVLNETSRDQSERTETPNTLSGEVPTIDLGAYATCLKMLATLDEYQRRGLSRRKKANFALHLAIEKSSLREQQS